mgnify:CR=1 FL=1
MSKKISFLIFTILFSYSIFAQGNKKSKEKIKSLKIAYITEQLQLTTKEAQEFWPIYNEFDKKQYILRSENRKELKNLIFKKGSIDSISNKEAKEQIYLKLENDKNLEDLKKEFVLNLNKIISYKKILKLQIAEMDFARRLMRKYKRN